MICTPICTESDFSPADDASTVKLTPSDLEGKKGKTVENQASGIVATGRLIQGEQMEEKYRSPLTSEAVPEKIIFTLHSANNLANMDYMGKSDPYAILNYGSQERRTTTINNNLNPVWNHQVTFDHEENADTIDIVVFDEDALARDDVLGRLSIQVAELQSKMAVVDAEAVLEESSTGSIKYSAEVVTSSSSLPTASAKDTSSSQKIKSSQKDVDESDSAKMAEKIEERRVSKKETTTFLTDLPQEIS